MKEKLLKAIGAISLDDVDEEHLLDILLAKLKSQQKEIKALASENAMEREDLHREREASARERHELYRNPNKFHSAECYFISDNNSQAYRVVFKRGRIELFHIVDGISIAAAQIAPDVAFEVSAMKRKRK